MPSTTTISEQRCSYCEKFFPTSDLKKHQRKHHPKCSCGKRFKTKDRLHSHQKLMNHCYCQECDRAFSTTRLHLLHARKVSHKQQYQCCDCKREYVNQHSLTTHCCVCDRVFNSQDSLDSHLVSSQTHIARARVSKFHVDASSRYKCSKCQKGFQNENSLKAHAQSVHKPPRIIPCPMGAKCHKKFATPSALFDHLESAGCKSKMNRQKLNELIIFHDKNHHITDKDAVSLRNNFIDRIG